MCTKELPKAEVACLMNFISKSKLSEEEWQFSKRPYARALPLPAVSFLALVVFLFAGFCFTD